MLRQERHNIDSTTKCNTVVQIIATITIAFIVYTQQKTGKDGFYFSKTINFIIFALRNTCVMEVLTRKYYADIVDSWIGKSNIIAIVGARRVGKSYVVKDFIQRHQDDPDANIIYIDKEKKIFKDIKTKDDLDIWIEERFIEGKHNYILIDEVQVIDRFEESLCNWYTEDNTDVIITGSNSKMLSGELATLISGRHVEVRIHPLTYSEFIEFHSLADSDESLMTYLNYGGLPGLRKVGLNSDEQVWAYLTSVFNTIMLKDIIERHDIRNIPFLNNLIAFYADTTGKLTSANSISKYMKSQQEGHRERCIQASVLSRLRRESGRAECRRGGLRLHQTR